MTTQHNKSVDAIRAMALQTGACKKINRVQDFPELIKLMFTPQGIEFCQDHNFPSVEVFRKNRDSLERLGVYVDAGNIALKGKEYVCIVGDTDATIEAAGTKFIQRLRRAQYRKNRRRVFNKERRNCDCTVKQSRE